MSFASAAADGCYDAGRAAALSGVPKTTVYWWASHGVVVPSVSPVREKLWSYSDLMALRIVSWLRHPKDDPERPLPASPMVDVRTALQRIDELGLDLWWAGQSPLLVDRAGRIFLRHGGVIKNLSGQPTLLPEDALDLTAPFGVAGPDLRFPRPHLRIVPAKVAGEPHIEHSRVTTQTVAALAERGYTNTEIASMYGVEVEAVAQGVELEAQLLGAALAA